MKDHCIWCDGMGIVPNRMEGQDGPICACGKPSRLQSGHCGGEHGAVYCDCDFGSNRKFEKKLSLYFIKRVYSTNVISPEGLVDIKKDIIWISTQTGKGIAGTTHDGWSWSFFGEAIHR